MRAPPRTYLRRDRHTDQDDWPTRPQPAGTAWLPSGIEKWATVHPLAAVERSFNGKGRCCVGHHYEAVREVLMDVSTHEGIHLVTARDDGIAVFLRQCWQDKAVS